MKRKRQVTPLPAIQITPVAAKGDPTGNESLAEYRRRTDREEKAQSKAQIEKAEADLTKTMRELNKHARDFWGRGYPSEGIVPQLYTELSKDSLLSVPDSTSQYTLDELKAAVNSWAEKVLPTTGYEFVSDAANKKFCEYVLAQAYHGKDVRSPAAITACFERLRQLDAFQPGELSFDPKKAPRPRPVEAPAPRHNLDNLLETVSAESTEGRKKLQEAIVDSLIHREWANCWAGFANSLVENFSYYLTEKDKQLFYDTMVRRNLNLNRPADYDICRVELAKTGAAPWIHLVYPPERLALEVEDADMNDYNVRREFARRTQALLKDQAS